MKKRTAILALLISILLVVNSAFIIIVQTKQLGSQPDSATVGGKIIQSLKGQNQLQSYREPTLKIDSSTKSGSTKSGTKTTSTSSSVPKPIGGEPTKISLRSNKRIIKGDNGFEMTVDYNKDTITVNGREIPIITDTFDTNQKIDPSSDDYYRTDAPLSGASSPQTWVLLNHTRFDVYVDQNYYNSNSAAIIDFFNKFESRYNLLESQTGWSSEKFFGQKLEIYVENTSNCYGGYAMPSEAHLLFSNPLYKSGCQKSYYNTFNGTPLSGNPGELGDNWLYMGVAIHEVLHSINPVPLFVRTWLTEGFSQYYMHNLLTDYGDINQVTSDTYIFNGGPAYNWNGYVANNYRDTTANNNFIQESPGYSITAWMFSKYRDEKGFDWSDLYGIMNNNLETLDKADSFWATSVYYTDTHVLDVFGKAIGHTSFDVQTKPIWRYDGPSGPGWGVRNFTSLTWYADLTPSISSPAQSSSISAGSPILFSVNVQNNGGTNLTNVSVRFYSTFLSQRILLSEQYVNVNAGSSTNAQITFPIWVGGQHILSVEVDEDDIKVETNNANNKAEITINVASVPCGLKGCI